MQSMFRFLGRSLVVVALLASVSCESMPMGNNRRQAEARHKTEVVQAEVMAFTDSYTAIVSQAINRITDELPEERLALHEAKLRNVQNAITIAAGPNPIGALLDMVVMVSLQRMVAEDYWGPKRFGDTGQPLIDALRTLEAEVLMIAERALDREQYDALRALIPEIQERFKGQVFVSSIRASDFAEDRRATVASLEGGGSLLSLFQLDPLAGLSPAAQELAQTRLLAERAFFWANRLPQILNWQLHELVLETMATPEVHRMLESATAISATAAELSEWIPAERESAFAQFREIMAAERTAAIEQLQAVAAREREAMVTQTFDHIAAEREIILRTFEEEDERLRGLLADLQTTVESTTVLSESLTGTIDSFDQMRTSFARDPNAPPREGRPFDITDYEATAATLTTTVAELNQVIVSVTDLMGSPAWDDRNEQIAAAAERAQLSVEALIDRSFRRGLILVILLVVGAVLGALAYRALAVRLFAPRV